MDYIMEMAWAVAIIAASLAGLMIVGVALGLILRAMLGIA
jgi:hypothetical protein